MKPQLTSDTMREPTCCCIGVRKTTLVLALVQASLLLFALSTCAIGLLRAPRGTYADGDGKVLTVSVREVAHIQVVEVQFGADDAQVRIASAEAAIVELVPESKPVDGVAPGDMQLSMVNEYESKEPSPCHKHRRMLLVIVTIGTAVALSVFAVKGVLKVEPAYLFPYCCMHLCDLLLTCGVMLSTCVYAHSMHEWIAMQRNVAMYEALEEKLTQFSDAEVHAILVAIGVVLVGLKALWFLVVWRCYAYLVALKKQRELNAQGLTVDHQCSPHVMVLSFDFADEEKKSPPPCYDAEAKVAPSPPPSYPCVESA